MKNKKLLLLVIGILLVLSLIFFISNVLDSDDNTKNNAVEEKTLLDIIKEDAGEEIKTEEKKEIEYNEMMINSSAFKYLIKIGKIESTCIYGNEFSDDQKLAFASSYAWEEDDENLKKNAKTLNEEEPSYINFEYLNQISKKFLGKEIVKENISATFDGEYVEISLPTSVPENLYKFKVIRYNSQSDVYSIYFDEIDPGINNFEEMLKAEKIEYNRDVILATYRILYKKVGNENVILGLHQIL